MNARSHIPIHTSRYDAIVFDLDGVVTDSAKLHAAAWKTLFDGVLKKHAEKTGSPFVPFDKHDDYVKHVDGKPRYNGVKDFLASRGIKKDYGDPSDQPDQETICGLGNKKSLAFQEQLEKDGVVVFDSTVNLIKEALSAGMRIGIISSSEHCEPVLKRANLLHLFEVKVDGIDTAEKGLKGKPHPDVFFSAADQLGVPPERCVVVEDALSGVRAGTRGNFGLVIGVDRTGIADQLLAAGADVVVHDLAQVHIAADPADAWLPSALESFEAIAGKCDGKSVVVFLDYDGTLTPIVDRPEDAHLADALRDAVQNLSTRCTVAIVSGRDRLDVQKRVQLDNLYYAGSHGFDIRGPDGFEKVHAQGEHFIALLDSAQADLEEALTGIAGAQVERKKFSIATHYRRVADDDVERVKQAVEAVVEKYDSLQKSGGKKVIEIQPDIDWHKGKALRWLIRALGYEEGLVLPLYIGDDLTDENAFREIRDEGISIVVAEGRKETAAQYVLADTEAVCAFLQRLSTIL
jgi:trehalose-phosphatase